MIGRLSWIKGGSTVHVKRAATARQSAVVIGQRVSIVRSLAWNVSTGRGNGTEIGGNFLARSWLKTKLTIQRRLEILAERAEGYESLLKELGTDADRPTQERIAQALDKVFH